MDLTLCGQSAFYYHRIPPQILGLYPAISLGNMDRRCCGLGSHAVVKDLLHAPLHRIVFTRAQSGSRSLFKSHLLTQEPPPGSFRQTEHGFDVTSPEFTLLNLATQVSRNQLLMACYEMCSSFAVYTPCKRAQRQLDEAISLKLIPPNCGWERVIDVNGKDTNLWKRTPLLSAADIAAFAKQAAGLRGVKQLRWAAERMTGQTASPFEVQTSMLISLPRDEGGMGINIANNVRIPLSDAERATALTSMGYDVIQITFGQIKDKKSFDHIAELIHKKAGLSYTPKTKQERAAEVTLRQELLVNWVELFTAKPAS